MSINDMAGIIKQPKPIRKQVYEHLQEQILNHTGDPSARLVEAQIAKSLGTSRTPVREALHLLEKDGFIESIPRVGYRVRELTQNEVEEILEIRKVNERLACQWALERINKRNLAQLEKNINATRDALKQGIPSSFIAFDEEFHEILIKSSGSPHLVELCGQLRRLMLRYRTVSMKTIENVRKAFEGHQNIFEMLQAGDKKGLEKALSDHLDVSRDSILAVELTGTSD